MEILSSKDLSDTKGLTLPMNICMEFSEIKWAWNSQLSILDCILKKKLIGSGREHRSSPGHKKSCYLKSLIGWIPVCTTIPECHMFTKKKILTSHLFHSTHQQGYLLSHLSFKKHRGPKAKRKHACLLEMNLKSLVKLIPGKVAADSRFQKVVCYK